MRYKTYLIVFLLLASIKVANDETVVKTNCTDSSNDCIKTCSNIHFLKNLDYNINIIDDCNIY